MNEHTFQPRQLLASDSGAPSADDTTESLGDRNLGVHELDRLSRLVQVQRFGEFEQRQVVEPSQLPAVVIVIDDLGDRADGTAVL